MLLVIALNGEANLASAVLVKWATLFSMNSLWYAHSPSCSFALSEIVCADPRHKFSLRHTRIIFYIPAITSCLLKGSHVLFLGVYSVLISSSCSVPHDNRPYVYRQWGAAAQRFLSTSARTKYIWAMFCTVQNNLWSEHLGVFSFAVKPMRDQTI